MLREIAHSRWIRSQLYDMGITYNNRAIDRDLFTLLHPELVSDLDLVYWNLLPIEFPLHQH